MLHEGFKKAAYRRDKVMTVSRFAGAAGVTPDPEDPFQNGERDIAQILEHRPDLDGQEFFVPVRDFSMARIYLAGDEVIKMPLTFDNLDAATLDSESTRLSDEIYVQKYLYDFGLPVPEVTFVAPGDAFFSMKKVDGIAAEGVVSKKDPDIAYELGAFHARVAMASLSETFNREALACYDFSGYVPEDFSVQASSVMADESMKKFFADHPDVGQLIENYVAGFDQRPYVLHHDDLNANFSNLLIDPDTCKLKAVIDFGELEAIRFPEQYLHYLPQQREGYLSHQNMITAVDVACYDMLHAIAVADVKGADKVNAAKAQLPSFRAAVKP
jgi:hypothetical protein